MNALKYQQMIPAQNIKTFVLFLWYISPFSEKLHFVLVWTQFTVVSEHYLRAGREFGDLSSWEGTKRVNASLKKHLNTRRQFVLTLMVKLSDCDICDCYFKTVGEKQWVSAPSFIFNWEFIQSNHMACHYVMILKPCCPIVPNERSLCWSWHATWNDTEQGGGLRGFAGRERREISLNDSSIRDLTWALIISWALLEISPSNKWQIWQAPGPNPPTTTAHTLHIAPGLHSD